MLTSVCEGVYENCGNGKQTGGMNENKIIRKKIDRLNMSVLSRLGDTCVLYTTEITILPVHLRF